MRILCLVVLVLAGSVMHAQSRATSIQPNSGSGVTQNFTAVFTDTSNAADIQAAYVDFGGQGAPHTCFLVYQSAGNALHLYSDTNEQVPESLTPGANGTLSNSQCTLSSVGGGVGRQGNTLTLSFTLTFSPGFAGAKTIYGYAQNYQGKTSGWVSLGTWTAAGFSRTWNWSLGLTRSAHRVYSVFSPQAVTDDVLITRIVFHVALPAQSGGDVCVLAGRDTDPAFPLITVSFSELLCFYALRATQAAPWDLDVDLSATPLYVPAGSKLSVGSSIYSTAGAQTDSYPFTAAITTSNYQSGTVRYRSLQIPYVDQANLPGGAVPPESIYQSTARLPLDVEAAGLFVSFGMESNKSNNACLEWKHGPNVVKQRCFPVQNPTGAPWNSPALLTRLGWHVPVGDTVDLKAAGEATDTQVYLLVKIPDALTGPKSAFGNYDNIPQPNLMSYCSSRFSLFTHPYFKTGDGVGKCDALYPSTK